jgi:hypothetical protein
MSIYTTDDFIFYPVGSEIGGALFSSVSGGSFVRSSFGFPFGFYWSGSSIGSFVENRFFGNKCIIYFFGNTGSVTITVNGVNVITDTPVNSFKNIGAFWIFDVPNLNDDYNAVRITVTATTVNVVGMLIKKFNAPFINSLMTSSFHVTNALNSSFGLYSTTTPLGANASVQSSFIDLEQATRIINWIIITVFSDQSGTLHVEFSNDNNNVDSVQTISYTGNTRPYISPIMRVARYVRIRYVNGSTAQSTFRLHVRGVVSGF